MYTAMDYIYEVYREKSFTKAAKKLFVSQPALSASVRKVEAELGAELFDRHTSPVSLTEAGQAYIETAEQIYATVSGLKERIDEMNGLKTGEIAVGGTNFVSTCVLPAIVKKFTARFPGIRLGLEESASAELKQLALTGGLDAVIDYDFDETLFEATPIREETIFLSAAKDSPQAEKFAPFALSAEDVQTGKRTEALDAALLQEEPFLLLKKGNDMHDRAALIFREAGIHPRTALELDQLMTSYALSCRGLGMAFIPDTLIGCDLVGNAVYFRLASPHATRTLAVARKKKRYVNKALEQFILTAAECYK